MVCALIALPGGLAMGGLTAETALFFIAILLFIGGFFLLMIYSIYETIASFFKKKELETNKQLYLRGFYYGFSILSIITTLFTILIYLFVSSTLYWTMLLLIFLGSLSLISAICFYFLPNNTSLKMSYLKGFVYIFTLIFLIALICLSGLALVCL